MPLAISFLPLDILFMPSIVFLLPLLFSCALNVFLSALSLFSSLGLVMMFILGSQATCYGSESLKTSGVFFFDGNPVNVFVSLRCVSRFFGAREYGKRFPIFEMR